MGFKVTVLGSSGGYPGAGRACSGYLFRRRELVVDWARAALANLLETCAGRLGGLALTHMHYDHYVDIYGLCTARRFWEKEVDPLPLLAPPHASEVITSPLQAGSREEFMRSLDLRGVRPGVPQGIAGFDIVALPAAHGAIDSLIYRISRDGKVVCYSGDTDLCAALVEQARGADLFICEATFTSQVRNRMQGHLFAAEAGEAAAEAGVGTLLLTHLWPTLSGDRALEDARSSFDGKVELAAEGMAIEL